MAPELPLGALEAAEGSEMLGEGKRSHPSSSVPANSSHGVPRHHPEGAGAQPLRRDAWEPQELRIGPAEELYIPLTVIACTFVSACRSDCSNLYQMLEIGSAPKCSSLPRLACVCSSGCPNHW